MTARRTKKSHSVKPTKLATLVSRLVDIMAEIEELGAGQIDSVVDQTGRAILLNPAQQRLVSNEAQQRRAAETQEAILNALPAHIALVDPEGTIVAVNERWKKFGAVNGARSVSHGIGINYLEVCERADGDASESAAAAGRGLRAVLEGRASEFALEYPCHSPTEKRWFRLLITALSPTERRGAVVMHLDDTDRILAQDSLRESEQRFRGTFYQVSVGFAQLNLAGTCVRVNDKLCSILLFTRPDLLGRKLSDLLRPEDRERLERALAWLLEGAATAPLEARLADPTRDVWVDIVITLQRDSAGTPQYFIATLQDITARKRAEQELRVSETLLRKANESLNIILDSSLDVICSFDAEGRFRQVNAACERVWGYKPEELLGTYYIDKVFPEDRDASIQVSAEIMGGKPTSAFENRFVRRDGSLSYIMWSASWSVREQTMFCVARDLTDRNRSASEIHALADRLTTTLESLTDGFVTVDRDWKFTYINRQAERTMSVPRETMLGKTLWDAFPSTVGTELEREYRRAMIEDLPVHIEMFNEELKARFDVRAFPSEYGLAIYFRDITESHRTAVALQEQATLLNRAQDAIVVRDMDRRVTFWNTSAERLYGAPASVAIGARLDDLLDYDREVYAKATEKLFRDGEWSGELTQTPKHGRTIVVESRWTLVTDEAGVPKSVLVINTDITERKQLEQQFLRAQRLESIGTLSGGIAHDFNNLLVPICMGASLLRRFNPDPRSLPVIDSIERSANRGARLVEQVLAFARGAEGVPIPVQLKHVIREVESIATSTFPKNIRIESDIPSNLRPVRADATQLNQVLLNLCVNARDAMPQGGVLRLVARNAELDEKFAASHHGAVPGSYAAISVIDSGTGISPEVIQRIFEPFFTTKALGKGTGLGLSTVMAIMKSHKGFVDVSSQPGHGSTFAIYIPVEQTTVSAEAPALGQSELPSGNNELILLVDDDPAILDSVGANLRGFGYRVTTALNGADGLAVYSANRQEISLVITDLMMPVMDGRALIAAIRGMDPNMAMIAASGFDQGAGAHGTQPGDELPNFLRKPFTIEPLLRLLSRLLADRTNR